MDEKNLGSTLELTASDGPPAGKVRTGNIRGNHFYNGLKHKRINGKLKVKGERKFSSSLTSGFKSYSPGEWKEHGPNPSKNQKKKQDETTIKTSNE